MDNFEDIEIPQSNLVWLKCSQETVKWNWVQKKKKRQATSTEETERNILEQIMEYIQQDANTPEA